MDFDGDDELARVSMTRRISVLTAAALVISVLFVISATSATTLAPKPMSFGLGQSAHSVSGVNQCVQSPTCDTRNANLTFKNYGSVCSYQDCNFVAAAYYDEVVLQIQPSPSLLKSEYQAAGQTFDGGLNMSQLWSYWKDDGVDGAFATNISPYAHSEGEVESSVSSNDALVIESVVKRGSHMGDLRFNSTGYAIMLVDGYDPTGPLVVFQGSEIQATWAQWNADVRSMWGVTASLIPPATTTTTSTTTTTAPTATTTTTAAGLPADDYGPQNETYQTYGNIYPADLGDCTFAGAANWEQIILGANPDPSVIGYEFAEAGGSATDGLSMSQLFDYWYSDGIAGFYLHGYYSYYTDQVDVENGVLDYGAMIVSLNFINGDYIGDQQVTAGGHVVVVDGYTPEGPLVVTWGTTIQMSWQQWNAEVTGMYGINASQTPN